MVDHDDAADGYPPALALDDPASRHRTNVGFRERLVGRWVLWLATTGVLVGFWGLMAAQSYVVDEALRDETVREGTVSRIAVNLEDIETVHVEVAGTERILAQGGPIFSVSDLFDGGTDYAVGDRVRVAMDPSDRSTVYDVDQYDAFSWPTTLLGLLFLHGVMVALRAFFTRHWLLRDAARWQWWFRPRYFDVTVLEVRDPQPPHRLQRWREVTLRVLHAAITQDRDHQPHEIVIEMNGRVHVWRIKSEEPCSIPIGTTFIVRAGRFPPRRWIVGLTSPALYPLEPLD